MLFRSEAARKDVLHPASIREGAEDVQMQRRVGAALAAGPVQEVLQEQMRQRTAQAQQASAGVIGQTVGQAPPAYLTDATSLLQRRRKLGAPPPRRVDGREETSGDAGGP